MDYSMILEQRMSGNQIQQLHTSTCLGVFEHAIVLSGNLIHCFLTEDSTVGSHHGRIILIHDLKGHWAYQSAVNVLGVRQALC